MDPGKVFALSVSTVMICGCALVVAWNIGKFLAYWTAAIQSYKWARWRARMLKAPKTRRLK